MKSNLSLADGEAKEDGDLGVLEFHISQKADEFNFKLCIPPYKYIWICPILFYIALVEAGVLESAFCNDE